MFPRYFSGEITNWPRLPCYSLGIRHQWRSFCRCLGESLDRSNSSPPAGAISRRRPPRGAFLMPRPMAVDLYSILHSRISPGPNPRDPRRSSGVRSSRRPISTKSSLPVPTTRPRDVVTSTTRPAHPGSADLSRSLTRRVRETVTWSRRASGKSTEVNGNWNGSKEKAQILRWISIPGRPQSILRSRSKSMLLFE